MQMVNPSGPAPKNAVLLTAALLAAKVVLLFVFAINTRFVMDEFWQFGQAKYLGHGLFDTIWPAKAVGYAVFYKFAHVIGWDAISMLITGRLQVAVLGCATLGVVYALARAIGENHWRSLAIVLLLLCFSTFMERIFRLRAEPLALFFAASALLVVVQGRADSGRRLLVAGILSGLAFLSTQKSIYFNGALGLALLSDAAAGKRYIAGIRRGALLVLGWIIPVLAYCLLFGGSEAAAIAKNLFFGPVEVATTGQIYYESLRGYVSQTLRRNVLLYVACVRGLMIAIRKFKTLAPPRRIALVFTIVVTVLVFAHNQPWPYVFIMALPFLALWVLGPLEDFSGRTARMAVAAVLVLAVALSFWRNVTYLEHDNTDQLAVIASADRLLSRDATYFDGMGMLQNHIETPRIWLDARGVYLTQKDGQQSVVYKTLSETPPDLIIRSYRTEALKSLLQPLLENRYQAISPNIMLPGRALTDGTETDFDPPVAGSYDVYGEDGLPVAGRIQIDGAWQNLPAPLLAGKHALVFEANEAGAEYYLLPAGLRLQSLRPTQKPDVLFEAVYDF